MLDGSPFIQTHLQPSPLTRGRISVQSPAGLTVAEIVRAARQGHAVLPGVRMKRGGQWCDVPMSLWGAVKPKPGTVVDVYFPSPRGGLAASALMAVLSAQAGTIATSIAGALGVTLTSTQLAIATAAVTVLGSLAISALIAPPQAPDGSDFTKQSAISGGSNQLNQYGVYPKVLGRRRMFPIKTVQGYSETVDEDIYWRDRMTFGWGPLYIEDLKIGEVPIHEFDNVELEFLNVDRDRTLAAYPELADLVVVDETEAHRPFYQMRTPADIWTLEPRSATGTLTTEIRVRTNRVVESFDVVFESRVRGNILWVTERSAPGLYRDIINENEPGDDIYTWPSYSDGQARDFRIRITNVTFTAEYLADPVATAILRGSKACVTVVSADVGYQDGFGLEGWRNGTERMTLYAEDVSEAPQDAVLFGPSDPVIRRSAKNSERIEFDVTFKSGVFDGKDDEAGTKPGTRRTVFFEYKPVGTPDSAYVKSSFEPINFTGESQTPLRRSYGFRFPSPGEYDLRVTAQQAKDDDEPEDQDELHLTMVRSFQANSLPSHEHVAEVAIRIKASDQINGQVQTLNGTVHQLAPVWDGSAWSAPVPVRHPAWIMADWIRGPHLTRPVPDAQIDLDGLKAWADEEPHWTCDFIYDNDARIAEGLRLITATGRATLGLSDMRYSVIRDGGAGPVVQVFTPRNSSEFRSRIDYARELHGVRAKFRSERMDWEFDEVTIYLDGFDQESADPRKIEPIELEGVVVTEQDEDLGNVHRLVRYHAAQALLRPGTYTWSCDFENLACTRGDKVRCINDVILVGHGQGRVKSWTDAAGNVTSITLDERFELNAGTNYRLTMRAIDGGGTTEILTATAQLDEVMGQTWTIVSGSIPASAMRAQALVAVDEVGQQAFDLLVKAVRPGPDFTAQIEATEAAPEVLDAVNVPIPAYAPVITEPVEIYGPVKPTVTGVVSDKTTTERLPDGMLQARAAVLVDPMPVSVPAFLRARWSQDAGKSWTVGSAVRPAASVLTGPLRDGLETALQLRSEDPDGKTRGWVTAGTVTAAKAQPYTMPVVALFAAAPKEITQGARKLPALRIAWDGTGKAEYRFTWRIKLASTGEVVDGGRTVPGNDGEVIVSENLLAETAYTVEGGFSDVSNSPPRWTAPVAVTTPAAATVLADLAPDVTTAIDNAAQSAATDKAAAEAAATAAEAAQTASETAQGLSETARNQSQAARDASQLARDAAQLAETGSEAARDASQAARTGSEAAQAAAETARNQSQTARDASQAAQTSAEADALAASGSASDASGSATSAAASATAAQTSESNAAASESSAATSETNAAGSASAAAASEAVTAMAKKAVQQLALDPTLLLENEGLTNYGVNGLDPVAMPVSQGQTYEASTDPEVGGRDVVLTGPTNPGTRYLIPVRAGRTYRVKMRVKQDTAGSGTPKFFAGIRQLDADGWQVEEIPGNGSSANRYIAATGVTLTVGQWTEFSAVFDFSFLTAGTVYVRPFILGNYQGPSDSVMRVSLLSLEDITESEAAADSAAAAATSETNAAASETAAGQSASAAQTAETAAETAEANAATSASQAATSETNAAGSASAAGTSETNAAQSATNAGNSATAAANSASSAASEATDAAQSATAAQSSETAAATSASGASTSAGNAATSETNAAGSETAAAASATSAVEAQTATELVRDQTFVPDFRNQAGYWINSYTQSKDDLASAPTVVAASANVSLVAVGGEGDVLEVTGYRLMSERNFRPRITGEKWRFRIKTRLTVDEDNGNSHKHQLWLVGVDANGDYTGYTSVILFTGLTVADGWVVREAVFTPSAVAMGGNATEWRLMIGINGYPTGGVSGATQQIAWVDLINVTAEQEAEAHAAAAATSESNAAASETAAGQSASAAQTAETNAETAESNASTSASQAATSATNAAGSASAAGTSESNAAQSATNAGNSATAASNSASAAATDASDAAQSATAAQTAETNAETAEANAATSASQAATSATNAAGSEVAAAASEAVAVQLQQNVQSLAQDTYFGLPESAEIITNNPNGEYPPTYPGWGGAELYLAEGTDPEVGGQDLVAAGYKELHLKAPIAINPNRKYRMRVRVKRDAHSSGNARFYAGYRNLLGDLQSFTQAGINSNAYPAASALGVSQIPVDGNWYEFESGIITGIGTGSHTFREGTKFIRPLVLMNYAESDTGNITRVSMLEFLDVTEEEEAKASAAAAATSESNAAASETAAGQSASAAQTAETNAETAESNAATSASQASTSATNAAGSASAAGTSETNAAQSATNAGNSATAASGSASTAASEASDAAQSATAAQTAETNAQTAEGNAATSASQAATSETNAAGSASAAASSETVAARSAIASKTTGGGNLAAHGSFEDPALWFRHSSGYIDPSPYFTNDIDGQGTPGFDKSYVGACWLYGTEAILIDPDRRYRYSFSLLRSGSTGTSYITARDANSSDYVGNAFTVADNGVWTDYEFEREGSYLLGACGLPTDQPGYLVVGFALDHSGSGPGTIKAKGYRFEDITESHEAAQSAAAAATSESNAAASDTAAGQSATAAQTAETNAETAEANAETAESNASSSATSAAGSASSASSSASAAASSASAASGSASAAGVSESNAATSASNAAGSAASAESAKDTAVAVSSQGAGCLESQFLDAYTNYASGFSSVGPNELYPTGNTLGFIANGSTTRGVSWRTGTAAWNGPSNPSAIRVDFTFELNSGNGDGVGIYAAWVDSGGSKVTTAQLGVCVDEIRTGEVMRGSAILERPAALNNSTFSYLIVYFMANYSGYTIGPKTDVDIDLHQLQIYAITATEAAVLEQATAIADLEGNASAGYLIKVQGGGAQPTLLSLISADGTGGEESIAKLSAKDILLDGSVTTKQLSVKPSGGSINPDPYFEDPYWNSVSGSLTYVDSSSAYAGKKVLRAIGVVNPYWEDPDYRVKINENRTYLLRWAARYAAGDGSTRWYGVARFFDSSGNRLFDGTGWPSSNSGSNNHYHPSNAILNSTDWQVYELTIGPKGTAAIPAGATELAFGALLNYQNAATDIMDLGAVELIELTDGQLLADGSVNPDKVDTAAFSVAGLSVFDGAVQSANYASGSAGWLLNDDGTAEFINLIVRESLVVGAASDGGSGFSYLFKTTVQHNTAAAETGSLGESDRSWMWLIGMSADVRAADSSDHRTEINLQVRRKLSGVWLAWEDLNEGTDFSGNDNTWQSRAVLFPFFATCEDLQVRAYVTIQQAETATRDNIQFLQTYARAIRR